VLEDLLVRLLVDEGQRSAAAPNVVSVGGAIAVEPGPVLLEDSGAYATTTPLFQKVKPVGL